MKTNQAMNEFPLLNETDGIPLFYPHMPAAAIASVSETLSGRWIGQGPKVDQFEAEFQEKFLGDHSPLAVGSGTDALHIAYLLAGVEQTDEVIVPVFTCTATSIPLLYIGAKPIFCDIDIQTMNLDLNDLERKITSRTKAVVCVDYGGVPNDYDRLVEICRRNGLQLISDAAHSLGSKYKNKYACQYADFTIFSFQAIKTLTTGDGGLVAIKDKTKLNLAKRLRWFGIDREAKQGGIWENDITDIGYKYQMNDIAAAIGLAGLRDIDKVIEQRKKLFGRYTERLNTEKLTIVGANTDLADTCPWLLTIFVTEGRINLMKKLREKGVESAQVHYRNDRYSIFGGRRDELKNMDAVEDRYIVLPLHTRMDVHHVDTICDIINQGW
jgi:dTDP-4-amino-4,6-dideoxygalactose transaminase